jgi:ABC-type dipeptide/oligopeptide/nickel transport system permease subunit
MRITDIQLAIPTILLAIAVIGVLAPGLSRQLRDRRYGRGYEPF